MKKRIDSKTLVVFIISIIAFIGNTAVWAFDIGLNTKDMVSFNFGVLFFLIAFLTVRHERKECDRIKKSGGGDYV